MQSEQVETGITLLSGLNEGGIGSRECGTDQWVEAGWIVSSSEPLLLAQLADGTFTYRSSDFTIKHNS